MTLFEARRIFAYWESYPPAHLILAARYGIDPRTKAKIKTPSTGISIHELKSRYADGVIY